MFLAILASVLTLSSAVPIGPPTAASTDIIYLVNCQATPGQSAMAYYASNYRALAGYEPDEIALVGTSPFVHWEGNTFEAEFGNGESRLGVFMTHINSGADEKVLLGGIAGTAEAEDQREFRCYKEFLNLRERLPDVTLFTDDRLGECWKVYSCVRDQDLNP